MSQYDHQQRFCRQCGKPVRPNARFCRYCGFRFDRSSTNIPQNPPQKRPHTNQTKIINIAIPAILISILLCICGFGTVYFFGDRILDIIPPPKETTNLTLKPRDADGTVSGSYQKPLVDMKINFTVSPDGLATYQVEGAPPDEILTISLVSEDIANLSWAGVTVDGNGSLNAQEKAALDNLAANNVTLGTSMIPLDLACQGDNAIDPKQLAALLFPLQMRFKYQIADRLSAAQGLMADSQCAFTGQDAPLITLSPATPVPVVFGYFPFDEEGAIGENTLISPLSQLAALTCYASTTDGGLIITGPLAASQGDSFSSSLPQITYDPEIRRDVYGWCNSMCRGACGVNCTLTNCTASSKKDCIVDDQGNNTGYYQIINVYDCGVHEGCITHDACYDNCNYQYGCGTWKATVCRHKYSPGIPVSLFSEGNCDQKAIEAHGIRNAFRWARGYDPFQKRQIFEYTDTAYGTHLDPEYCPADINIQVNPDKLEAGQINTDYQFVIDVTSIPTSVQSIRFAWDFDDEGSPSYPAEGEKVIDGIQGSASLTIDHKYEVPDDYELTIEVYDYTYARNLLIDDVDVPVEILPADFYVYIEPSDTTGIQGEPLSFSAVVNNPGEYTYNWQFGNTLLENQGADISFTFTDSGEFAVKVNVYDSTGTFLKDANANVIIYPPPTTTPENGEGEEAPVPILTNLIISPDSPYIGTEVQFWVEGENLPAEPAFDWDFGEPFFRSGGYISYQLWTKEPEAVWVYYEAGNFEVTVVLRDNTNYSVILDKKSWYITVQGKEED
jgi:hypothetical protein